MPVFRPLDETRLQDLDDAALIAYILDARASGDRGSAEIALKIFAFGMEDAVRAFIRGRLGSHGETDSEEVIGRTLEDAIRSISNLRGSTPQEARGFVFKIARLRIADFHRRGRLPTTPIDDGDRLASATQQAGLRIEDESDSVDTAILLDQVLAEMRIDHRVVVEHFIISGYSARETSDLIGSRFDGQFNDSMSEQNVHQIASRFRKELRARLEQAGEAVAR